MEVCNSWKRYVGIISKCLLPKLLGKLRDFHTCENGFSQFLFRVSRDEKTHMKI